MADGNGVVKLSRCLTEVEAIAIADALREEGIHAEVSGAITGGFRAEAPSAIWVLVREADAERARRIVEELRTTVEHIDWSKVDIGEPEDGDSSDASP